jgi:hypothetical protein
MARLRSLCYNIAELREYLQSTQDVYIYKGSERAYQLPPLYWIDDKAKELLLTTDIRKYRGLIRDANAEADYGKQIVLYTIEAL